jgi:hypothetical protein
MVNPLDIAMGIGEAFGCAAVLDQNNILWRFVDGRYIGKRQVTIFGNGFCWLENTTKDNVKYWPHGEDADYSQIFYR